MGKRKAKQKLKRNYWLCTAEHAKRPGVRLARYTRCRKKKIAASSAAAMKLHHHLHTLCTTITIFTILTNTLPQAKHDKLVEKHNII